MRISVLPYVMTSMLAATPPALAQDVAMNLGFGTPEDSLYGDFARLFKQKVENYTAGEVEVKIRCCNQISTEDDAFKAMQLGTVDGFFITTNNVSPHWPLMDVTVLPYIFQSSAHLEQVLDGPIGEDIKERLQAETSVHLLNFGPTLYRDFFNAVRPVESMDDMKGLKIRVPNNEVMLATFEAFGANAVPLAWSETPTALQTRTVDGADSGTSFVKDMKFYEFQPNLAILEHFVVTSPLFASDTFMKRLTDAQREQVIRAANETGLEIRAQAMAETEEVREWLAGEGGMTITHPDKAEFIAAGQKVQDEFAERRGPEFVDIVKRIQAEAQ